MPKWNALSAGVFVATIAGSAGAVFAAESAKDAPKSLWQQETLTGDWGGTRTALKDKGIDVSLIYINEVLSVLSGGINQRASYEGRFDVSIDTDLGKLAGLEGFMTHVTVFNIHGSEHNVATNAGSLADPSNIDAVRTTRLFTAWLQYGDPAYNKEDPSKSDRFSFRIGQLAADDEFLTSPTAGGLINGTFGWATIASANLLSGGLAYPLATPGARIQVRPIPDLAIRAAVFSGDPAGDNCVGNPQVCNFHGTTFSFDGGALAIAESELGVNQAKAAKGLPGLYKIGFWYATANYADVRFPRNHDGNWGIYGVIDQIIWQRGDTAISLFTRGGATPSDRNTVSFYVDGGVGVKGLLPGRVDDTLTFGVAYEKISPDAVAADRDAALPVVRSNEVVFEVSYMAQIAPWWTIQPDFQYIVHPGGRVSDPANPLVPVRDAAVIGVRSVLKF
jgi:porin